MSRIFAAEISQVISRVKAAGAKLYDLPWYLVVGEPMVGKSASLKALNLSWQQPPTLDGQYCQYWLSKEAVLIEAREPLVGPNRNAEFFRLLCEEIRRVRPREPLDGIIVVISATDVAERAEENLEAHAQQLRAYLIEACRTLQADIPVYTVVNRYDTLWGFAEVFAWNAERAKEDMWGFLVPPNIPSQDGWPKIQEGLTGLLARVEAHCLSKLSSEDGVEQRIRAYQHLVEARQFLEKLRDVLKVISFSSAYERAPWLRAVTLGCSVPGAGDRIRAGIERFQSFGLLQNPYDPHKSQRPGGLPLHGFFKGVVLPEKELVPLVTRWRDDPLTIVGFILAFVLTAGALVVRFVLIK
ncbi:MAG: type VI secretion system protein [Polyangiaceae bacterium]